jgi:GMP synthase (glutamine-hydrolysing)
MKTALVVRHVVFEGVAGYREPIEAAGYEIVRVAACETDFAALDVLAPDLLVVMGGPMGVYETAAHPWLNPEIAAIRTRLAADRPTLGVCLGSQLIATALGARVYPGPVREIGFSPLRLTSGGRASSLRHVDGVDVLHWHGDTFDLPEGVDLLAGSAAYVHQDSAAGRTSWRFSFMRRWAKIRASTSGSRRGGSISKVQGLIRSRSPATMTGSVRPQSAQGGR